MSIDLCYKRLFHILCKSDQFYLYSKYISIARLIFNLTKGHIFHPIFMKLGRKFYLFIITINSTTLALTTIMGS